MTPAEILRNKLWGVFKLLELANVKALESKRTLALIANLDPDNGDEVLLFPSRFEIDGHQYGAMVTQEQQTEIQLAIANGTAEDVLNVIANDLLIGHLYLAVALTTEILVAALRNQALPQTIGGLTQPDSPQIIIGACKFSDGSCRPQCGGPLCKTLGGTPAGNCDEITPPIDGSATEAE